jgi:AAA+ superfamily predicted ATPase
MTDEIMTERLVAGNEFANSNGSRSAAQPTTWCEANQRYLAVTLTALRLRVESALRNSDPVSGHVPTEDLGDPLLDLAHWSFSKPPAVEQLCSAFHLSTFERGVVLLGAGAEMDSRLASFYASANPARHALPTLNLALNTLPDAHWSALSPSHSLRFWQLIDVLPADTLVSAPFRINERILHYLAGIVVIDERLHHVVRPVPHPESLPRSFAELAGHIARMWTSAGISAASVPRPSRSATQLPVVELCGADPDSMRAIAAAAAALVNLRLYAVSPRILPHTPSAEAELLLRICERECVLSSGALLLELEELPGSPASPFLSQLLESLHTPIIVATRHPYQTLTRPRIIFYTSKPTRLEQAELWRSALQSEGKNVDPAVACLTAQFNFGPVSIRSAAHRAGSKAQSTKSMEQLWNACRVEARPRLEGLAQHIESAVTWDDLVLPERELEQLRQIAVHVRQRIKVHESWGFAERRSRGLGISALFTGPSGTGKTTAAEVLAHELRLDLFRIDLSQVISKYIGETEKNLSRVFDAAEGGSAVLLFDEADALFGKRTEVKDSHDRYANIEVSYLLQRMEAYRGLAILTTNRKSALDQAFLRRLRFIIEFAFPDAAQRVELWRRIFPARTPTEALNIERLARLRVSGGNIHNIAMAAAFLAADAGQPVRMEHLLLAARSEFAKLETPLSHAEVAGWL